MHKRASLCFWFPLGVVANYAIGDKDPMCWTIVENAPMVCPSGLVIDWVNQTLPNVFSAGVNYRPSIRIAVTKSFFVQLGESTLLPLNHSANSFWVMCAQKNIPCLAATPQSCCYWHVNLHSCQNSLGVFCGPWVTNDSVLATHTVAQSGFAGVAGNTTFSFIVKLFWQGMYTVIAHLQIGNIHVAVGRTIEVRFSANVCAQPLVPSRNGSCEPCPAGTQTFSAARPQLARPYTNAEAIQMGVNPYCIACPVGMFSSNNTKCLQCKVGTFAAQVGTSKCLLCEPGKFSPQARMGSCDLCADGTFSQWASRKCTRCPQGRFRNSSMRESLFGNESDCQSCPNGLTTLDSASVDFNNCTCKEGFFLSPELGRCRFCLEGLVCEGGVDPPKQDFGYYALEGRALMGPTEHDYVVFICASDTLCAKGTSIGECMGNRHGLACSECFAGFYPHTDGTCRQCAGSADLKVQISISLLVGAVALAFIGIWSMTSPRLTRGSMQALGTVATVFFMNIQGLAAYCSLPIQWSAPLTSFQSFIHVFAIQIQLIEPNCLLGVTSVVGVFGVSIAIPPTTATYIFILWMVLKSCRGDICKNLLYNAIGLIWWLFFLTITLLAISPLHCLENPGGIMTVARYKGVTCWRGGTHRDLLILSAIALITQPLPIIGVVVYACFVYNARMAQPGGVAFLKRFDFLFKQFSGHCHKFVLVILARNLLLATIPVMLSNEVEISLVIITFVILVYTSVQGAWKPWKGWITNVLDRGASMVLILVGMAGALLRRGTSSEAKQAAALTMWIVFSIGGFAFLICVTTQICVRLRMRKTFTVFLSHHKLGSGVTCRLIKEWLTEDISGKVFYDSDELDVISDIHHIVAEHTQAFFLVLSTQTLKRLWCCVEVVAAVKFRLPVVVISCDGAALLDSVFLENDLPMVWTHQQWSDLGVFGIDINIVRDCYAALNDKPILALDRFAPIQAIRDIVVQTVNLGLAKRITPATKTEESRFHTVEMIITGNSFDGEAVMTCHLLRRYIQRCLGRELAIVKMKEDVECSKLAEWMIVVLTAGVLENYSFPALLAQGLEQQIMLMPVRASDAFGAPTEATYACLNLMTFDVPATVAVACYKTLFNTIALAFSTLGSKAILEVESTLIAGRLVFSSQKSRGRIRSKASVDSNSRFRITHL